MKLYDNAADVSIETFQEVLAFLQSKRVAPQDIYAYALALDVLDATEEFNKEEADVEVTVEDTFDDQCRAMHDDPHDTIDEIYNDVHDMLVRMGKIEKES